MWDKIEMVISRCVRIGLGLIALVIILQVIFGSVTFFPVDIVGSVMNIIEKLGSGGFVGLLAVVLLGYLIGGVVNTKSKPKQ